MIKNEFYKDEFEQLLKEKADQFSMYPSRRVWHSIYNNLHPGRRWPSVVISLFLISSLILIGYLNTGENSITQQINISSSNSKIFPAEKSAEVNAFPEATREKKFFAENENRQKTENEYPDAFADFIINGSDLFHYTIVKSNRPSYLYSLSAPATNNQAVAETNTVTDDNIIQKLGTYIKSNQIFADVAALNKKNRVGASNLADNFATKNEVGLNAPLPENSQNSKSLSEAKNLPAEVKEADAKSSLTAKDPDDNMLKNEEKAWIENYAMQHKSPAKKWKGRLGYQFYVTPAVNYRKLTTKSKGSTSAFATADINNVISQKPGFGFEAGAGLTYALTKRLQLKAGAQFNYTNYKIDANLSSHPITTTILLNDPYTGYSYSAERTSTTSNTFNSPASSPVRLHNRTYQVSLPVGFGYKISSQNNVEWFAGATVQPTYYFGGNAHLISSDLKSYVSEPSSINSWNLNLGFETYMNFKLGNYNFQVGPQVRYQVNSTYRRNVALIEKPYAVGLKFGLSKGF